MDIKAVVKKYGFTVNSLAKKHNIGQSRLNQMVNGNPSGKNLEWLASLIGCHPAEFFADWQGGEAADGQADAPTAAQPSAEQAQAELPFDKQPSQEQQMRMHLSGIGDIDAAMPPAPPEKPAASEQPQGTALVGLVRCPQCGRAIRLFAEE